METATKTQVYRTALRATGDKVAYLREHSGLPGPRANLELIEAIADEGDASLFWDLADRGDEFLASCGVVGLGRLAAEGDDDAVAALRERASDGRWRVREAVAMALQRVGDADISRLLVILRGWLTGTALERRAVVAAVCEPRLLRSLDIAQEGLRLLDEVTDSLRRDLDRHGEPFRVLRQALGYGWSVAIVAAPQQGRVMFARLAESDDPDVRWIVRENLGKARLRRLDQAWVDRLLARLEDG